ncbi:MAG: hypothetical protein DRP54_07670 [Spirochaetes bacterium]|nr:MAG: hypothetical protein DRP54_07670 [Spirochaetota bacterium]
MYAIYLIVYGIILTGVLGVIASWIDRKVTARIHYRVGPPFLQPVIDIIKLMGKETVVPEGASKTTFLLAPIMGYASISVASAILWMNQLEVTQGFLGDIIVVIYLLTIPSISLMLGGFASGNPLARVGASREMKLMLSYELPFIFAILVPIIKSNYSLRLGQILASQAGGNVFALSFSGAIALIVSIICIQAKMGIVPFDIAEAETEIMGGVIIEYSGTPLAIFRLMKHMMLFTLPFFLIILYLGGFNFQGIGILYSILKYVLMLVIIVVIKNTNPRVRIDHAMRFFWGPATIASIVAIILSILGI